MFNSMWRKTYRGQGYKIGLWVCPMIGAIHWYQFYAGTPSSLFVRHCLVFDFYFFIKKYYVQLYVAKNL